MIQQFPAKIIENICSYKNWFVNVYGTIIHNSQKIETTQMSINGKWINKILYNHAMEYYLAIKKVDIDVLKTLF